MSFFGSYTHTLDSKKRVFIPAKYRDLLGNEFYITRKTDACLSVYTVDEWKIFEEKLSKLPSGSAAPLLDFIYSATQKCTPDSNGRIIIDDKLLKYAKINKNVVFTGAGSILKIWAEEVWNEHEQNIDIDVIDSIMDLNNI